MGLWSWVWVVMELDVGHPEAGCGLSLSMVWVVVEHGVGCR